MTERRDLWGWLLSAFLLAGCSSGEVRPPDAERSTLHASLQRDEDIDVGIVPIPDAERIFAQALPVGADGRERALLTGLQGAVQSGTSLVTVLNRRTGLRTVIPTTEGPGGVSFRGLLDSTRALDVLTLWPEPGGPGINSIDEVVQRWFSPYPSAVGAMVYLAPSGSNPGGLFVADRGNGLFRLSENDTFERYTAEDGLPSDDIAALAFDGRRLWIGGQEGEGFGSTGWLACLTWDAAGLSVARYGPEDGVPDSGIRTMISDRRGGLWIGAFRGIGRMTREAGGPRFLSFRQPGGSPVFSDVRSLTDDGADGVWLAGSEGLVHFRFAGELPEYTVYYPGQGVPENNAWTRSRSPVEAVGRDGEGNLWLAIGGVLGRASVQGEEIVLTRYPERNLGNVTLISPDPEGGLLIGTETAGVFRFRMGRFAQISMAEGLSSNAVSAVASVEPGLFYLGSRIHGVSRIDLSFPRVRVRNWYDPDPFPNNYLLAAASDGGQGVWFAVYAAGVTYFRPAAGIARTLNLAGETVFHSFRHLEADGAGGIWASGNGGPLTRLGIVAGEPAIRVYTETDGVSARGPVSRNPDGSIWVGGPGGTVHHLRVAGDRPEVSVFSSADGLPGEDFPTVTGLSADGSGGVWLIFEYHNRPPDGARHPPLVRLSLPNGLARVEVFSTADGLRDPTGDGSGNALSAVASDGRGGAWVIGPAGLTHLSRATDGRITFASYDVAASGYSPRLLADRSGGLWIADRNHPLRHLRIEGGAPVVRTFTASDGLPGRFISGLALHPAGGLWGSSYGGGAFLIPE